MQLQRENEVTFLDQARNQLRTSDGVTITHYHYHWPAAHDDGHNWRPPVTLQHGFTVDSESNWLRTVSVDTEYCAGVTVKVPD